MGSVLAHCSLSPGPTAYTATGTTLTAASRLTRPLKLQEAPVIEDVKLVGDYGFDPLGLGTDETLVPFREAELKHARLAMLAAVAWPLQEIFHPILVDSLHASGWVNTYDMMAETSGKSPSLLNGGLEQWETAPVLMLAIFCASTLELTDLKTRQADGLAWNEYRKSERPGDFGFDPLNIARSLSPSRLWTQPSQPHPWMARSMALPIRKVSRTITLFRQGTGMSLLPPSSPHMSAVLVETASLIV